MTTAATESRVAGRRQRRPSGEPPPLPYELNHAAIAWTVAFVFWSAIWTWVFLSDVPARWITERDLELMAPIVDHRSQWLTPAMQRINELGTSWLTPIFAWTTILGGLIMRRIRHVLLLIASLTTVAGLQTIVAVRIGRPRPLGVEIIGDWSGFAQPSRPIAMATTAMMCAGLTLVPAGRLRHAWAWTTAGVIAVIGVAQVYVGVDHPSDVLPAATVGVAIPLVLYRLAAPEQVFPISYHRGKTAHLDLTERRTSAIRTALARQLGIEATGLERIGLASSAGSTPLRIGQADGPDLFGKLYAGNHLRSDRSYKLWRELVYGRLEDERRYASVRRLVQHEDYILHVFERAGIRSASPLGIVEITPDREYLLVCEFLDGATEIGAAEITDDVIDSALAAVSQLWDSGLAHRDVKPANVMVRDERVFLIDVSFAEVRPSPWRQAVDLANMMLVLALGSDPERVYERALLQFSEADIAEAFAASRGVTLPSALRTAVKRDGRDLLERFRELAPGRRPVAVQRWSVRRIGLVLWVVFVIALLLAVFVENSADVGLR